MRIALPLAALLAIAAPAFAQDIAPVAAFLASADSGWITGEIVQVAGGLG